MSTPEMIVTRYYAAFNTRDFDAYDALFSPDVEIEFPGVSAHGVKAMRGFDMGWVEAFPEARLEVFRLITCGNSVAGAIWFNGGPQRAAVTSPAGTIPAAGKALDCPGFVIFTLDGDRIVKQQIGIEPSWIPRQLAG